MQTTAKEFYGVDPGRTGAIAVISADGRDVRAYPMPPALDRGISIPEVRKCIPPVLAGAPPVVAIEWNQARPGEVPDYAFRFGLQTGQLDAVFQMRGFDVVHVSPKTWKPYLGLPGKQADPQSVQGMMLWDELYPQYSTIIRGPRGGILDGPLDALLIAHWLRITTLSPVGAKGGKRRPKIMGLTKADLLL